MANKFKQAFDQQSQQNPKENTPEYKTVIPGLNVDFEFATIIPETVDYAIKKWFEEDHPLYTLEKEDRPKKIKVVFSTTERWAMMQRLHDLRDENGLLILPLISIKRNDIQQLQERTVAVDSEGTANITLYVREYINPESKQKEYIANFNDTHDRKSIVEIIQIQPAKVCKFTYSVVFWSSQIQDLNPMIQHMIQNFGNRHSIYVSENLFFPAFLENLSNESNDENISSSERIFKNNFTISVDVPIIDINSIKTYRTYQGMTFELFSGESSLSKYQSAKLYNDINFWDSMNPQRIKK